ncbi:MAG: M28 family peptidase [Balneolaceae bacterium]|nr:M28 family peptidase [Balneolaceae bacterium]MCH8549076.1 M28 family peptidase [Balneolaceae bacterium]
MERDQNRLTGRRSKESRHQLLRIAGIAGALIFLFGSIFVGWLILIPPFQPDRPQQKPDETMNRLAEQLESDVRILSEKIGERNMNRAGTMDQTVQFLMEELSEAGYEPEEHPYRLSRGRFSGREAVNLSVEVEGETDSDITILIGAHYDSVFGSPGANDNGSGVAVLLALARYFSESTPPLNLRFLFFANEEPPFFKTDDMGSLAYVRDLSPEEQEKIGLMISLDGLGYFDDAPRTQRYPLPGMGLVYPGTADFIGFVTRLRDRKVMKEALLSFRKAELIDAEGAALPGFLPGVDWSDHWSFWQHGIPALLITDTLPFRDPAYHAASDTAERLDYQKMAAVTKGIISMIEESSVD